MDFLKEKLGDKYDEFMELIGDTKLKIDDGSIQIPKSRFDEVNERMKKAEKELENIKREKMTDEEKLEKLMDEANEMKAKYAREMAKLKASEVFVKAGLTEEEYSDLVENLATEDEEKTIKMAEMMVNVLNSKKEATEKQVKEQLLKDTPKPPTGELGEEDLSIGEQFAKQANEVNSEKIQTLWD